MSLGTVLRVGIACLLAALLVDGWLLSGLFRPVIVASGSMAPALRGPHRAWTCAGCGAEFFCGHESLPPAGRAAVCPYCRADNDPALGVDRPGDRVLVDRGTYVWRAPRRWEKVALRCPGAPGSWCVKRIVGLPGERVEIRNGDVWIDGRLAPKDLVQLRDMAVLVYQPAQKTNQASKQQSGWTDPRNAWRQHQGRWVHVVDSADDESNQTNLIGTADADTEPDDDVHWLQYEHPPVAAAVPAFPDGALDDESPYDQSELRSLNPVGDHLLRARVTLDNRGELLIRARSRGDTFQVRLDLATGAGTLSHNGQTASKFVAALPQSRRPVAIAWMLADGRAQLRLDGRIAADTRFRPTPFGRLTSTPAHDSTPLAIGARRADVRLEQIAVYRDLYYTGPESADRREYQLGDDEYYVLGDNSPHSEDSRSWPRPAVGSNEIVGRVLHW